MIGAQSLVFLIALIGATCHADPAGLQISTFSRTRTKHGSEDEGKSHRAASESAQEPFTITESSTKILFYSEWSSWSSCLDNEEQTRQRLCQLEEKCGNIVIKETRRCKHHATDNHGNKTSKRRRHRHKHGDFHVVPLHRVHTSPPSWRAMPVGGGQTVVARTRGTRQRVATRTRERQSVVARESAVIFPNAGVSSPSHRGRQTSEQRYESKLYGKWSRWSQCTRSCTTQRRRLCKRRDLCGMDVIREAAYCYIEGSFCQRWIYRKIQQTDDENEAATDLFWFDNADEGWESNVAQPEPPPPPPPTHVTVDANMCGVAGDSSSSRSLGNMLRIIGGRPTAKGRWPWQVAVLNRFREAFCGGTLVAPRWVLTAAHCVRKRLYVRLGEHDLAEKEGTEIEFRVERTVTHPGYDAETVDNDVALLRLPTPITPDRYRGFVCLPGYKQALPTTRYCTIIGWGKRVSSDTFGTDVLHEAKVPIVSNDVCRNVYHDYHITNNMFCAGYRRGRMDSCAGDSGGPLLCQDGDRWTIYGITSFGEGCGKKGKYGIYARLSNYIKWIQKIIKEKR